MRNLALAMAAAVALVGCGTPCDKATKTLEAKYEECGVTLTDAGDAEGEEVECTEELGTLSECTAACTEAADCVALDAPPADLTSAEGVAYTEAVTALGECNAKCLE